MVAQTPSTAKTLITQTMAALSGRRLLQNSFQKVLGAEASLKSNSPKSRSSHNQTSQNEKGESLSDRQRVAPELRIGRQHPVDRDNRGPRSPKSPSNAVQLISYIRKAPSIRRTVKITRLIIIGMVALGSPIRRSFRDNDLFGTLMNKVLEAGVAIRMVFRLHKRTGLLIGK